MNEAQIRNLTMEETLQALWCLDPPPSPLVAQLLEELPEHIEEDVEEAVEEAVKEARTQMIREIHAAGDLLNPENWLSTKSS